jgi:hypothetical protein
MIRRCDERDCELIWAIINSLTIARKLTRELSLRCRMLAAYTAFHNYSFANALLALEQCIQRNLEPGPLNTYRGWLERKRHVRKGETGITRFADALPRDRPREHGAAAPERALQSPRHRHRSRQEQFRFVPLGWSSERSHAAVRGGQ